MILVELAKGTQITHGIFIRRDLALTHTFPRFGYIQFSCPEEAALAIEKQNLQFFAGRKCVMQFARTPVVRKRDVRDERPTNTLFVGNIPYELTDRDLQELFSNVYDVVDIRIPVDRRNGSMRGFAHVEFTNAMTASEGKEILINKRPYGRRLMVEFSDSKKAVIFSKPQGEPYIRPQGESDVRGQWTGARGSEPQKPSTRGSEMQEPATGGSGVQHSGPEEPLSPAEIARRRKEARLAAEEEARIEQRIAARLAAAQKTGSSGDS